MEAEDRTRQEVAEQIATEGEAIRKELKEVKELLQKILSVLEGIRRQSR